MNHEKVYLSQLHIKIGLIKNFVETMDQNSAGFTYLKNKFPRISNYKIKEGVFVGHQIRKLIHHHYHHLPPWIRSLDLFRHRRVAIVS
jgi:hypothetical protein